MIDYDSSLNSKQIHDLLQHVCSQHIDFVTYAHTIPPVENSNDSKAAWNLFKTLSSKEKFYRIYQCLNESTFKLTLLSLLNVIKTSSYCVTNGTFICLRSHLENLFNSSLRILEEPSKFEKSKPQDTLKLFEFDQNVLWNPEKSEWLLNNICMRSSLASLFIQPSVHQNQNLQPSNFFLVASSSLILDIDTLEREIELVLADQFRYMQAKLTSTSEVEESIRQINEGSRAIPQVVTSSGKYTFIATFSLASLIAKQIQSYILLLYRCNIIDLLAESTRNTKPNRRVSKFSCDPTPDYLLTYLSAEESTDQCTIQFSSCYVRSKWKSLNDLEKRNLLTTIGLFTPVEQHQHQQQQQQQLQQQMVLNSNQKQKSKSQKFTTEQLKSSIPVDILEYIQPEFMFWYSRLPHVQEIEESKQVVIEEEYLDLEAPPIVTSEPIKPLQGEHKFLVWCRTHQDIGAELCEYISFCPLLKLFSQYPLSSSATHAAATLPWSWCRWACGAFTELESMYHHQIGDQEIVALFSNQDSGKSKNKNKNKKIQSSSSSSSSSTLSNSTHSNNSLVAEVKPKTTVVNVKKKSKKGKTSKETSQSAPTPSVEIDVEIQTKLPSSSQSIPNSEINSLPVNFPKELLVESIFLPNSAIPPASLDFSQVTPSLLETNNEEIVTNLPNNDNHLNHDNDSENDNENDDNGTQTNETKEECLQNKIVFLDTNHSDSDPNNVDLDKPESQLVEGTTRDSVSQRESDSFSSVSTQSHDIPPNVVINDQQIDLNNDHTESVPSIPVRNLETTTTTTTTATTTTTPESLPPLAIEAAVDDTHSSLLHNSNKKTTEEPQKSPPSSSSSKNADDFLGTESQIFSKKSKKKMTGNTEKIEKHPTEPQRNSAGSHSSRIDLIQWDHQRRLTEILTEDILDMASNLYKIAQLRRPWQSAAIDRVRAAVQSIWPQAQCDIFGSFGTGLAIPSSDVDIVVTGVVNQLQWWGGKPITPLAILSQHLQLQDWVSTVRAIEHTLMPVIKITTAPVPMPSIGTEARKDYRGVIKIDISIASVAQLATDSGAAFHHPSFFNPSPSPAAAASVTDEGSYMNPSVNPYIQHVPQTHNSYPSPSGGHPNNISSNSAYQFSPQSTFAHFTTFNPPMPSSGISHQGVSTRDFVLRLCAMNPSIIPLVLVMKQFLQEKGLHDPFTGGLSSYAVTIMMASILQPHALERPEIHPDLGTLFLSFLKRYGTNFDTRKYAVVLSINGPFVPLSPGAAFAHVPRVGTPNYWKPAEPVVVTDPLNSQNNLGRSCFGFRQIQTEFDNALDRALQCLDDGTLSIVNSDNQPTGYSSPENSMGKIFHPNKKTKSILGAIFGTIHHDSVVKLQAQIWCPLEVWSPNPIPSHTSTENNNLEPQTQPPPPSSSHPLPPLPPHPLPPQHQHQHQHQHRPSSLKRDSLTRRLIRKECEELLSSISDQHLEEVKNMLINIKEKNVK